MPSRVPRTNTTKKREQLERREQELRHAVHSGLSRERIVHAAEAVRHARLSLLKAELYWAIDLRGDNDDDRLRSIRRAQQRWTERPVDEIVHDYTP